MSIIYFFWFNKYSRYFLVAAHITYILLFFTMELEALNMLLSIFAPITLLVIKVLPYLFWFLASITNYFSYRAYNLCAIFLEKDMLVVPTSYHEFIGYSKALKEKYGDNVHIDKNEIITLMKKTPDT